VKSAVHFLASPAVNPKESTRLENYTGKNLLITFLSIFLDAIEDKETSDKLDDATIDEMNESSVLQRCKEY